eukprot:GFYU01023186.1.p1 GENE.GFYU01023186.1~~GFYU01023186.1.p1  ORF type:complete len:163 (-),score=18.01 GFYU01023186.1:2-490(-)
MTSQMSVFAVEGTPNSSYTGEGTGEDLQTTFHSAWDSQNYSLIAAIVQCSTTLGSLHVDNTPTVRWQGQRLVSVPKDLLFDASAHGSEEAVEALLDAILYSDSSKMLPTLVAIACQHHRLNVLSLLFSRGGETVIQVRHCDSADQPRAKYNGRTEQSAVVLI